MSSRIRIMVACPVDKYMQSFIGNKAVNKLRDLYLGGFQAGPTFSLDNFGNVLVNHSQPKAPEYPPELPKWKLAKWYYDKLSPITRASTMFIVTREGRSFDFSDSITNPSQHGYVNPYRRKSKTIPSPSKASWNVFAGLHDVTEYSGYSDSSLKHIPVTTKKKKQFQTGSAPGEIPQPKPTLKVGIWS